MAWLASEAERLDLVGVEPARDAGTDPQQPDGLAAALEWRRQPDHGHARRHEREDRIGGVRVGPVQLASAGLGRSRAGGLGGIAERPGGSGGGRAELEPSIGALEQQHRHVGAEELARVGDDGLEHVVHIGEGRDRHADAVERTRRRATRFELHVARTQRPGQGVDLPEGDHPERDADDQDGDRDRERVERELERLVEHRVAEQLEHGDDQCGQQDREPAKAQGSSGTGHVRAPSRPAGAAGSRAA